METPEDEVRRWAGMFDGLAETYDQSGVAFFGPIAAGLVDRVGPRPGERAADIGAGRGAATFRLAEAVGPGGGVDAIDLAPGMVELTGRAARERGLSQVRVALGDATDPPLSESSYDVLTASLVLFFLPDPVAALRRWAGLLVPGGRLGVATFRPWPPSWQAVEDLFAEYADDTGRPGPTTMPDVYSHDAGVELLLDRAGLTGVRTETADYPIVFADVEQWRVWSLGTAMRGLWLRAPEESHPEILGRVADLLESTDGTLDVSARYTLGARPE